MIYYWIHDSFKYAPQFTFNSFSSVFNTFYKMKEVRTTFAKENTCQPVLCKSCSSKELVDPRKICVNAVPNCWHDDEHRVYNWIVEALTTSDESVFMYVYYLKFWQHINKIVFQKECRPYKCNLILQKYDMLLLKIISWYEINFF